MNISLLTTIILMVLFLAITIGVWARHHRVRPIVWGLGLTLIPLGSYLLGTTDLAVNGVMSLIDWAQRTVWTDIMTWGAGLLGGGILLFIIGQFLPKGPKELASGGRRPQAGTQQRPQVGASGKQAPTAGKKTAAPAGKNSGLSDEDREIEELLRNRGIM